MSFISLALALFVLSFFSLHSMECNEDAENSTHLFPARRAINIDVPNAAYRLKNGNLATRLITMVTCYSWHAAELHLKESKILRLIRQNPGVSNPYSDGYNAHLITLAARYGYVNIVKAIVESNPESINCFGVYKREKKEKVEKDGIIKVIDVVKTFERETPLDEAVLFRNRKVAAFLHKKGAPLKKVSQQQLDELLGY